MKQHVGVVIRDRGSAIVTVQHDEAARLVTAIECLPFDLAAVASRVRELPADGLVVIDADGLGSALWGVLGRPEQDDHWSLYAGRGVERQALVDELLVVVEEGRFHFARGLAEQEAMSKALVSYRRQVREDGLIGSELVVALLLAILPPKPVLEAQFAWGRRNPFGPPDESDGARIAGLRLVRDPSTGMLVGVPDRDDDR